MNKKLIGSAVLTILATGASIDAIAALTPYSILDFNDGISSCIDPNSCSYGPRVTGGSYFAMDVDGNGQFSDTTSYAEHFAMTRRDGIIINTAQPASGTHSGPPNGTENASIDMPFLFYGNTGLHQTTSPVSVLSDDGAGHITLDFSGWQLNWYDADIPLGGSSTFGENGIAQLTCSSDCSYGDNFTLNYTAHVSSGGFMGVYYGLHLEGIIGPVPLPDSVPVPAAVWLFGSGLIGLFGCGFRKKVV